MTQQNAHGHDESPRANPVSGQHIVIVRGQLKGHDATWPEDLPGGREAIEGFPPFIKWLTQLEKSLKLQSEQSHQFHDEPYKLFKIDVQSFDQFGSRLGFLKLKAEIKKENPHDPADKNHPLPGIVFLRGPAVAMLIVLTPDDVEKGSKQEEEDRQIILTIQPRIPAGSLEFVELPAGMVDDKEFKGAVAEEIKEELGMTIKASELKELSAPAQESREGSSGEALPVAMYPSAGGCDEYIRFYTAERRLPRNEIEKYNHKLTGLRDHGEKITLKLVKLKDLWKEGARDSKCLAALALWEGLKREGRL
ncbi:hypothetical protein JX266_002861 [Neoarthrinium moseri]|nr:hypothetical protein JX266_002861 [Neoarthrinium moseri]